MKIVLFAYSRGIVSSRKIAKCCEENIIFMALSADTRPHFTTIADFISTMDKEVTHIFRDVLLVCDDLNLIGKEMFAIDGCKLPSNASKEWSGTKKDFEKKAAKLERAIGLILDKHREHDLQQSDQAVIEREEKYVATLQKQVKKIREWLDNNDDKHQVIVHAEAFGQAQEHDLLKPMIEGTRENFEVIGEEEIDGYVADNLFRRRNPRFADYDRYKERTKKERANVNHVGKK